MQMVATDSHWQIHPAIAAVRQTPYIWHAVPKHGSDRTVSHTVVSSSGCMLWPFLLFRAENGRKLNRKVARSPISSTARAVDWCLWYISRNVVVPVLSSPDKPTRIPNTSSLVTLASLGPVFLPARASFSGISSAKPRRASSLNGYSQTRESLAFSCAIQTAIRSNGKRWATSDILSFNRISVTSPGAKPLYQYAQTII